MRWWWSALIATACAGGQTGEITDLTACHAPVGVAEIDAPSAAGAPASEQLDGLTTELAGTLPWEDGSRVGLEISLELTGDPGTLLGGPECARPWLEAPVVITARTADGALDEAVEGVVVLTAFGASARAEIPARALAGSLMADHPELDAERATLHIELTASPDALGGTLTLTTDGEDDQRLLASF